MAAAQPQPLGLPAQAINLLKSTYRTLVRAVKQWIDADGLRMSAAMSFTEFSAWRRCWCCWSR